MKDKSLADKDALVQDAAHSVPFAQSEAGPGWPVELRSDFDFGGAFKGAESSNQALNAFESVPLARSNWTLQATAHRVLTMAYWWS